MKEKGSPIEWRKNKKGKLEFSSAFLLGVLLVKYVAEGRKWLWEKTVHRTQYPDEQNCTFTGILHEVELR